MSRTSFSRLSSALILASILALPGAARADGPAFGSGAGAAEQEDGGYLGSGHKDGVIGSGTKSAVLGSDGKDGGILTTSGGLRSWALQIRMLARLGLSSWAGL
ncbi:MAG TPA: hypothetical protein VJ725_28875 [Thermoanaerobaculia bacterium]|nr:hypothetical protein [Thermoanaerobaculia bacterium]